MAGTLTISTLSDGTNSTSATNPIMGSAKAWVNFTGATPPVINASYNISSITRSAAGVYRINMTNALADANYAVVGMGNFATGYANGYIMSKSDSTSAPTTTGFTVSTYNIATTAFDGGSVGVAVFR